MRLEAACILLVIPGWWTFPHRTEKPQGVAGWPEAFTINDTLCQAYFRLSCPLVEVPFLRRLEATRVLKHHSINVPNITEIQAIAKHPVYTHIAYKQHALFAVTFSLRSHQPSEQPDVFRVGFNNSHILFPPLLNLCITVYRIVQVPIR
jgi:hypothetical protein